VTKYSVTAPCRDVDAVIELGAVGEFCWPQDTIISAASRRAVKGAMNLGEVNDIGYSCKAKFFTLIGSKHHLRQKVNHELKQRTPVDFNKQRTAWAGQWRFWVGDER
jgi:hypothetical protein